MKVTTLTPESIDQFRNWLSDRGRSAKTGRAYATDLSIFLAEAGGEPICLTEEYEAFGLTWLQRHRQKLAPKTTLRRRTSLSEFGKWAGLPANIFQDWIGPTPARGMPHPLPEGMDGVRRMVEATKNEKHRALVALLGYAGCRVGEAVAVKPSHFDTQGMSLTIRGKGDKTRIVPVTDEAWAILAIPTTRALIEGRQVVGIDERFARRKITQLGIEAGLQRSVASHDLRATLATHLYNKTRNMRLVQEVLGHSSVKTTQLYLGVDFEDIREGMRP